MYDTIACSLFLWERYEMKRIFRSKVFYLLIFLVTFGIVLVFNNDKEPTEKLTEDEFLQL